MAPVEPVVPDELLPSGVPAVSPPPEEPPNEPALPPLAPDCVELQAPLASLRIAGVVDGSVLRRAPGSPRPPQLALRALGTREEVRWLLDGHLLGRTRGDAPLVAEFPDAGPHRLLALDPAGRYAALDLRVAP